MPPSFLLVVIVSAILVFRDGATSASSSDQQRLETLSAARKTSRHSLVPLSVASLRPLIENAPRSYSLIVVFTADQNLCKPCAAVRKQVQGLSEEFSTLPARRTASKPVFFAEVMLSQNDQQFLAAYGIRHVPILYHFAPGSKSYPTSLSDSSPDSFDIQRNGIGINSMRKFVNDRTGSSLKVVRGGYEVPFVQTVRKLKPYIIILVITAATIALITGAYKNPMLWFAIVVMVYIFSVGGGHYSWIHNTPFVVVDNNGRTQYISGGNRSQYVAEGFFVSLTCVCISGLVILIQELPTFLPQKSAQSAVGFSMFLMTVCAIGALLSLYQSVSRLLYAYSKSDHVPSLRTMSVCLPCIQCDLHFCFLFFYSSDMVNVCRKCQGTCITTRCKTQILFSIVQLNYVFSLSQQTSTVSFPSRLRKNLVGIVLSIRNQIIRLKRQSNCASFSLLLTNPSCYAKISFFTKGSSYV